MSDKSNSNGLGHLTEEQILRVIEKLDKLPGMQDPYPLWGKIVGHFAFGLTSLFTLVSICGTRALPDLLVNNFSTISAMAKISMVAALGLTTLQLLRPGTMYRIGFVAALGWVFTFVP